MTKSNISKDPSSNKITKESFINFINKIVLFVYATLVALEFRRYISSNPGSSLTELFLALEGVLLLVCIIKIILFFAESPIFSILSILIIVLSVFYHLYKFDFQWRFYLTTMPYLFTLSILMISMYKIPFSDIIKTFLITVATLFIIRFLGAATKILPSEKYNIGNRTDIWDLGFGHYNTPLMYFFFICIAWIYQIRSKKSYIVHSIIILILTLILYKLTTSRTASLVLLLGVCALIALSLLNLRLFARVRGVLLSIYRFVMLISPALIAIISFGGTLILNYIITTKGFPANWSTLFERFVNFNDDCAMNGVYLPWSYYADNNTDSTFSWIFGGLSQSKYSDNIIQTLLISYGPVILGLYIVLMTIWAYKSYKAKNDINLLIIGLISLLSTMQPHAILYGWNPFLMLPFAFWGANELELKASNPLTLNRIKAAIKNFMNKMNSKSSYVIPLALVYTVVSLFFMIIVAYQLITNVVSDYFFWWMLATVYGLLIFDSIMDSDLQNKKLSEKSFKTTLKQYGPRIALMIVIFVLGSVGIMQTIFSTTSYVLDIEDTRIDKEKGMSIDVDPSFRQIFKLNKSGLKKVSIFLSDYSENTSDFGFAFVTTNNTNGVADVIVPSDYSSEGVIEIDTSNGSFKAGDVCILSIFDINEGQKDDPIIRKITYTFVDDINYVGCALLAIPVLLAMLVAWVGAALRYRLTHNMK